MERLADEEYRALAAFRQAIRRYIYEAEHAAKDVGITPTQHQLILAVRGYRRGDGQAPSISELSQTLYTQVQSTYELVARAEEAGLVTTTRDDADARRRLVHLTQRGIDVLDTFYSRRRVELSAARDELHQAVRRLRSNLS